MATTRSDRELVTIVLVLIAALVVLPAFFMALAMVGGPMMGGAWGHGMWGDGGRAPGWAIAAGFLVPLVFLAVIVAAGYLVYRTVARQAEERDPALEELRRAYARGDLTDEEFESRRKRLEDDS